MPVYFNKTGAQLDPLVVCVVGGKLLRELDYRLEQESSDPIKFQKAAQEAARLLSRVRQ